MRFPGPDVVAPREIRFAPRAMARNPSRGPSRPENAPSRAIRTRARTLARRERETSMRFTDRRLDACDGRGASQGARRAARASDDGKFGKTRVEPRAGVTRSRATRMGI